MIFTPILLVQADHRFILQGGSSHFAECLPNANLSNLETLHLLEQENLLPEHVAEILLSLGGAEGTSTSRSIEGLEGAAESASPPPTTSQVRRVAVRACRHVQPCHGAALQSVSVQVLSESGRVAADRGAVHVLVDEWSDRGSSES